MKNKSKILGKFGERLACEFLNSHNYKILKKNYFSNFGEIDIIAQKNDIINFVEIKTRSSNFDTCFNSVSKRKQKKIILTAMYFIEQNPEYENCQFQFDVIGIIVKNNKTKILHLKDAFSPIDINLL